MALISWVGNAPLVNQQGTITPVAANNAVYKVGIPTAADKTVSYTASGAATVNEIVNALVPLLQAKGNTEGEFAEVSWSAGSGVINWTVKEAGRPVTIASTTTGGGSLTTAETVSPSSPNDANIAANYSTGALPGNTDDLVFDQGNRDVKWNLSALSAVALTSFKRTAGYTGKIGLDTYNKTGKYQEYRATEFTIKATNWDIEQTTSDQASQIKLNAGSAASTFNIHGNSAGTVGREKLELRGTNAANAMNIALASVSVAPRDSLASTINVLNAENSTVSGGPGVTWGTVNNNGSLVEAQSNIATLTHTAQSSRTVLMNGGGTTTKTDIKQGRLTVYDDATLTGITIGDGGVLDLEQDMVARTISGDVTMEAGSSFLDRNNTVASWVLKNNATLDQIKVRLGAGRTLTIT